MNTSHNKYDTIESLISSKGLVIESVEISPENDKLFIKLNTEITFITPTKNYKGLKNADEKSLKNFRLVGKGVGIHWPDLDEDLSLKGFITEFLSQKMLSKEDLEIA